MTNQSIAGKRLSKAILSAVLVLVLIVTIFTSTAFARTVDNYDVTIIDNGESYTITTNETEPIDILKNAGISFTSTDALDISDFVKGEGGEIVISRLNTINVKFDGTVKAYKVYATTVGEAFNEIGIKLHDSDIISHSAKSKIKNGMVITYDTNYFTLLSVDGTAKKCPTVDGTVKSLLKSEGITLGKNDYVSPKSDTQLKKGMKVTVFRVNYKNVTKTETINYKTKKIDDKNLEVGKTKVVQKGVKGSANVTYKVKYVNGEKVESTQVKRVVTKKTVTKKVKVGTKTNGVKPNGVKQKNGLKLGQVINGNYTHYCACYTCNGSGAGTTASGKRIYNGMKNPYYIACNWAPLGTVLEVDGQIYTVVDRGGSGLSPLGRIDLFTPEGHAACYRMGRGSCTIKVLRIGW